MEEARICTLHVAQRKTLLRKLMISPVTDCTVSVYLFRHSSTQSTMFLTYSGLLCG